MAQTRITWARSAFGSHVGSVGGVRIFTLSVALTRDSGPYSLAIALPGYSKPRPADSEEQGKALAERILAKHVETLGATFTDGA